MDSGTGFPSQDAQDDFARARRAQLLADLGRRLRREPGDVALILPFDEVVDALGLVGESQLGLQSIALDSVVGTVDRTRDFDRGFRPTTPRVRGRWQRIAAAQRRGESFPPISVYRIGDLHFVRDGHHRVSVAKSLGRDDIDAYVTDVRTRIGAGETLRLADLPLKDHERLFHERVPLDAEAHARLAPSDPWDYGRIAEAVEAWGFRAMQERREYMDREEVARLWYEEDFLHVVDTLRAGEFIREGEAEGDAYMRVVAARYELLRTHEWSDEVLDRLQGVERRRRGIAGAGAAGAGAEPALRRSYSSRAPGWPGPGQGASTSSRRASRSPAPRGALPGRTPRRGPDHRGSSRRRRRRRPGPPPPRGARARAPRDPGAPRPPGAGWRSSATRRATSAGSADGAAARRACRVPSGAWADRIPIRAGPPPPAAGRSTAGSGARRASARRRRASPISDWVRSSSKRSRSTSRSRSDSTRISRCTVADASASL